MLNNISFLDFLNNAKNIINGQNNILLDDMSRNYYFKYCSLSLLDYAIENNKSNSATFIVEKIDYSSWIKKDFISFIEILYNNPSFHNLFDILIKKANKILTPICLLPLTSTVSEIYSKHKKEIIFNLNDLNELRYNKKVLSNYIDTNNLNEEEFKHICVEYVLNNNFLKLEKIINKFNYNIRPELIKDCLLQNKTFSLEILLAKYNNNDTKFNVSSKKHIITFINQKKENLIILNDANLSIIADIDEDLFFDLLVKNNYTKDNSLLINLANKNLSFIKRLINHSFLQIGSYKAIRKAVELENIEIIKFLIDKSDLSANNYECFRRACTLNNMELIQLFHKDANLYSLNSEAIFKLMAHKNLNALKLIRERIDIEFIKCLNEKIFIGDINQLWDDSNQQFELGYYYETNEIYLNNIKDCIEWLENENQKDRIIKELDIENIKKKEKRKI